MTAITTSTVTGYKPVTTTPALTEHATAIRQHGVDDLVSCHKRKI